MSSGAVIIFALNLLNYVTAPSVWMNYPDKWNTNPRLLTVGGTQMHYTVYNRRPRCTDRPDLYRLHSSNYWYPTRNTYGTKFNSHNASATYINNGASIL